MNRSTATLAVCAIALAAPHWAPAQTAPAPNLSANPALVEAGGPLFRTHCVVCHGVDGDQVNGIRMSKGEFHHVSTDADMLNVILNGVPGTGMPPSNLPLESRTALVAYVRSLHPVAGPGGDPARIAKGRAVAQTHLCLSCHRINGEGSRVGPELSDIGALRTEAQLRESIVNPGGHAVLPQHVFVQVTTNSGQTVTGLRLNEDTHTIQIMDPSEHLRSFDKSSLRSVQRQKESNMPSYQGKLSAAELDDLVYYLFSLKGAQ